MRKRYYLGISIIVSTLLGFVFGMYTAWFLGVGGHYLGIFGGLLIIINLLLISKIEEIGNILDKYDGVKT